MTSSVTRPPNVAHHNGVAQLEAKKMRRVHSSVEAGQYQRRQAGQEGQVPLVEAAGEVVVAVDKGLHISHGRSSLEPWGGGGHLNTL